MILESSLILQIIPPKNPGVSFNQERIPRSEPIGADLACRLLDFRTWLPVTRHSLDGHTPGWSNKPSVSNLPVKTTARWAPETISKIWRVFLGIQPFFLFGIQWISPARWALSWLLRWHGTPINGRNINGLGDRCYNPTVIGVKFHPRKIWASPWRVRSQFSRLEFSLL